MWTLHISQNFSLHRKSNCAVLNKLCQSCAVSIPITWLASPDATPKCLPRHWLPPYASALLQVGCLSSIFVSYTDTVCLTKEWGGFEGWLSPSQNVGISLNCSTIAATAITRTPPLRGPISCPLKINTNHRSGSEEQKEEEKKKQESERSR